MKFIKINHLRILVIALITFFIFGVIENGFGDAIKWPVSAGGNGHYYMAVFVPAGITWDDANAIAIVSGGYLATITSAAENDFVYSLISGNDKFWYLDDYDNGEGPWLGGYQPPGSLEPSGGWQWVTGEPWGYTNWALEEPNNFGGDENRLVFFGYRTLKSSYWNDVERSCNEYGYIIEFENQPNGSLIGKWGYVVLEHENIGLWGSTAGTFVFNADGTGTDTYQSNDGGILTSKTKNFTYSTNANQDGSTTLTMTYAAGTDTIKIVISDNGNMFIVDGTADVTEQAMMIAVKMDPSKTCTNADVKGEEYIIEYEYDTCCPASYNSWSGVVYADGNTDADGNGTMQLSITENDNGTINTIT